MEQPRITSYLALSAAALAVAVAAVATSEATGKTWVVRPGDFDFVTEEDLDDMPKPGFWPLRAYVVEALGERVPWNAPALAIVKALSSARGLVGGSHA